LRLGILPRRKTAHIHVRRPTGLLDPGSSDRATSKQETAKETAAGSGPSSRLLRAKRAQVSVMKWPKQARDDRSCSRIRRAMSSSCSNTPGVQA